MDAFVRRLAALSVLWALCELLLPDNRGRQMVRMTVSVLVMTALLSTVGEALRIEWPETAPTLAGQIAQSFEESHRLTALQATANQLSAFCQSTAARAGYAAQAEVSLRLDGSLEGVRLHVQPDSPLITPEELRARLAQSMQTEEGLIQITVTGENAP